jgi:hypothetical protein
MGRMCVAGHNNFGCKELEECSMEWSRMASNPNEDQGSQRVVVTVMMMMSSGCTIMISGAEEMSLLKYREVNVEHIGLF